MEEIYFEVCCLDTLEDMEYFLPQIAVLWGGSLRVWKGLLAPHAKYDTRKKVIALFKPFEQLRVLHLSIYWVRDMEVEEIAAFVRDIAGHCEKLVEI